MSFFLRPTDNLGHPFGLDISENRVFWTDWDNKSAFSADKLTGQNITTIIANTSDLMDIRVFHRSRRSIQNACGSNNGGCSHLCLLNPMSFTCACPVGVQLRVSTTTHLIFDIYPSVIFALKQSDLRTCAEGPSRFIIFAHRIDIRQISLDFAHFIDVVLPMPPIGNAVALDVDSTTGVIYWSDSKQHVIMSSTPDGLNVHKIIGESLDNPDGLIVDSVGKTVCVEELLTNGKADIFNFIN